MTWGITNPKVFLYVFKQDTLAICQKQFCGNAGIYPVRDWFCVGRGAKSREEGFGGGASPIPHIFWFSDAGNARIFFLMLPRFGRVGPFARLISFCPGPPWALGQLVFRHKRNSVVAIALRCNRIALQSHCIAIALHWNRIALQPHYIALHCFT